MSNKIKYVKDGIMKPLLDFNIVNKSDKNFFLDIDTDLSKIEIWGTREYNTDFYDFSRNSNKLFRIKADTVRDDKENPIIRKIGLLYLSNYSSESIYIKNTSLGYNEIGNSCVEICEGNLKSSKYLELKSNTTVTLVVSENIQYTANVETPIKKEEEIKMDIEVTGYTASMVEIAKKMLGEKVIIMEVSKKDGIENSVSELFEEVTRVTSMVNNETSSITLFVNGSRFDIPICENAAEIEGNTVTYSSSDKNSVIAISFM